MPNSLSPREILEKLVSFPTVSRDSNLELVDWVEEYLASFGVKSYRDYNEEGTKASIYAHIGPEVDGGIILSGHTDVVPVDGQAWDTDPFVVTEKDGKLYGRGTCDMKGFDALALSLVPLAVAGRLKKPLQICLSRDEEIGCTGAPPMIKHMIGRIPKAAIAIIGEPTEMRSVTGHKGGLGFDTHLRGFEIHSSLMDQGVSAIMEGARLIEWANRVNAENKASADPSSLFNPPYTTAHVGMIEGGTAHNITAKDCRFVMSFRCVPGETTEQWGDRYIQEVAKVQADMQTVQPSSFIEVLPRWDVPGLKPEVDGAAEALSRRFTGDNGTHVVSFGTEAGQFQEGGYSAVVCGPGNIEQAHQANEFITLEQFAAGEDFMHRLLDHLSQE